MTAGIEIEDLILKVLKAERIDQILDLSNFKTEFRGLLKTFHPDVCSHARAKEVTDWILRLKDRHENGVTIKDEAGTYTTKGMETVYSGDSSFLKTSHANYITLMSWKGRGADNFRKYIPKSIGGIDNKLQASYHQRAVPLTGLTLEQKHVNWIFSRMLEYAAYMQNIGYSHCGINPESVFVIPENHGIQVSSFYMMTKIGDKPSGISGMYQSWYPPELFRDKKATPAIDVELCKKTAISLLGDKSGVGIKLRKDKNVHQGILDFLISRHDDAVQCFAEYRTVLGKHFKKEFHVLDL